MKRLSLFLSILMCYCLVNAQQTTTLSVQPLVQKSNAEQEQEVEKTMRLFYASMDEIIAHKNGNIEPATKMLDKDFSAQRLIIDVAGNQTRSSLTLDSYRAQLNQIASIPGFKTLQEITRVDFTKAFESFAIISYTLQITGMLNDEEVLRFRSYVTTYLRRNGDGQWTIFESNGVNLYQDQEVGVCPVAFAKVSKDESLYSASILSPAGNSFKSDKLDFSFKQSPPKTIVTCGKNVYVIEGSMVTCIQDNGSPVSNKLGKASSPIECINLILSQHLYAGKCLSFKTMEK